MPARNVLKVFDENGFYHIYNRGVERRAIFADEQDYSVFLGYLKFYLGKQNTEETAPSRTLNNYTDEIDLLCYCLMPNHFHLLVHQHTSTAMTGLMQSLGTKYVMYFNRKYEREGNLFQSRYKAVSVESEEQLVYLTHYIHRNPRPTGTDPREQGDHLWTPEVWLDYKYSSVGNYLYRFEQDWIKPGEIVNLFSTKNPQLSYLSFLADETVTLDEDLMLDGRPSGSVPEVGRRGAGSRKRVRSRRRK